MSEETQELTAVTYRFFITDKTKTSEIIERVIYDVGKECLTVCESDPRSFKVINYEYDPDNNADEFIYGWEWLNERFPKSLALVSIDY